MLLNAAELTIGSDMTSAHTVVAVRKRRSDEERG